MEVFFLMKYVVFNRVPPLENAQRVGVFGVFRLVWDVFITMPHPFKAYAYIEETDKL